MLISETLQEQNVKIMQVLGELQVLTKLLVHQEEASVNLKSTFPLEKYEDLIELDRQINNDNKHLYVSNLHFVFSISIVFFTTRYYN